MEINVHVLLKFYSDFPILVFSLLDHCHIVYDDVLRMGFNFLNVADCAV